MQALSVDGATNEEQLVVDSGDFEVVTRNVLKFHPWVSSFVELAEMLWPYLENLRWNVFTELIYLLQLSLQILTD